MKPLFNKKEKIIAWLDKYLVYDYTLVESDKYGWVVNVEGVVKLMNMNISQLKVKFNHINGDFICYKAGLTTLLGAPEVVTGHFMCVDCKVTSLEYGPKTIGKNFDCRENFLTTLEHGPTTVVGLYDCRDNRLKSLDFLPETLNSNMFHASGNPDISELLKDVLPEKEYVNLIFDNKIPIYDLKKIRIRLEKQNLASKVNSNRVGKPHKL